MLGAQSFHLSLRLKSRLFADQSKMWIACFMDIEYGDMSTQCKGVCFLYMKFQTLFYNLLISSIRLSLCCFSRLSPAHLLLLLFSCFCELEVYTHVLYAAVIHFACLFETFCHQSTGLDSIQFQDHFYRVNHLTIHFSIPTFSHHSLTELSVYILATSHTQPRPSLLHKSARIPHSKCCHQSHSL